MRNVISRLRCNCSAEAFNVRVKVGKGVRKVQEIIFNDILMSTLGYLEQVEQETEKKINVEMTKRSKVT